jgi:hypothetical protein
LPTPPFKYAKASLASPSPATDRCPAASKRSLRWSSFSTSCSSSTAIPKRSQQPLHGLLRAARPDPGCEQLFRHDEFELASSHLPNRSAGAPVRPSSPEMRTSTSSRARTSRGGSCAAPRPRDSTPRSALAQIRSSSSSPRSRRSVSSITSLSRRPVRAAAFKAFRQALKLRLAPVHSEQPLSLANRRQLHTPAATACRTLQPRSGRSHTSGRP